MQEMMNKRRNQKGFTLAELLIVVAIIAVLVAIAIPIFSAQLDKSRLATATANARSVTADYVASCLGDGTTPAYASLNNSFTEEALAVEGAEAEAADKKVTVTYNDLENSFKLDDDFE
jgi:prepilin-type N-terminal cleavage/methylation domain-containing protein